jgi:glycosyltransferase involved in cell wall biosynthesis
MRILVVTKTSSLLGGVEVYLRDLLPMLVARGHVVQVATEDPGEVDDGDWLSPSEIPRPISLDSEDAIERVVREFHPDVIFNNQVANPDLEERILSSGPAVLFVHTHHGLCVSGKKMHALPRPVPCARPLGAACLALYFPRRCGGLNPITATRNYSLQLHRRQLFPRYRRLLVASRYMRDQLVVAGVTAGHVVVAPYFTATRPLERQSSFCSRPLSLRVLFMGRLTDVKGCLVLIAALEKVRTEIGRPLELVVAGVGPIRAEMEQRATRCLSESTFLGWVDDERKRELLVSCDLLVLPSLWQEPFGIVGIEAAAVGVPAVAFDVGGIREWLDEGQTGEIASSDPPTAEGLADAILRAARDPVHLEYLGEQARIRSSRFSLARHLETLETTLQQACGRL